MKKNKKKAFTLVELLAVIVILAIILIIAVPSIMNVIESSRLSSIESSAKVILNAAKKKDLTQKILDDSSSITCEDLTDDLSEYSYCAVEFGKNDKPYIKLIGDDSGKFSGYYCDGSFDTLKCFKRDKNKALITFEIDRNDLDNVSYAEISRYYYEVDKGTEITDGGCVDNEDTLTSVCTIEIGDEVITTFEIDFVDLLDFEGWKYYVDDDNNGTIGDTYTVNEDVTITNLYDGCILKGTKVNLGNNVYKNVEDLTLDDKVMSYNFETGEMELKEIYSIVSGKLRSANVYTVYLDNGNILKIVNRQDLFDMDNIKFITLDYSTYKDIIGTNVMTIDNGIRSSAKIIDIVYSNEEVEYYDIYTKYNYNFVAEDIVVRFTNLYSNLLFKIKDDYTIDMDALNKDIEKYGLYTYDEFKDIIDENTFDSYNVKYLKIVVDKGYISYETMLKYLKIAYLEMLNSK